MTTLAARMSKCTSLRSDVPLSDSQIQQVAPSIFATEAHHSRSERYAYIPTATVLAGLRDAGFQPFMAAQAKTRIADKLEFTRHMLRLRHVNLFQDSDATQEIILVNSHDGTSSYQLISGVFRFVCTNGMVCGTVSDEIRVHHKGDIAGEVIEGAFEIVKGSARRQELIEDMRHKNMSSREKEAFANAAIELRFGENNPVIETGAALVSKRWDDDGDSQWHVFNRVQENLTHGGMVGRSRNNRRRQVRAITGMDRDTQFNRSLWRMMAALRGEEIPAAA